MVHATHYLHITLPFGLYWKSWKQLIRNGVRRYWVWHLKKGGDGLLQKTDLRIQMLWRRILWFTLTWNRWVECQAIKSYRSCRLNIKVAQLWIIYLCQNLLSLLSFGTFKQHNVTHFWVLFYSNRLTRSLQGLWVDCKRLHAIFDTVKKAGSDYLLC